MRHGKRGRHLNRTPEHRKAMLRNLVNALFEHGRVTTTPAKAKEARPFAEKMITLAKKGELHHRRQALAKLHDKRVVANLFSDLGPRYQSRPGGYCRILHLPNHRIGDGAPQVIFELVEAEVKKRPAGKKAAAAEVPVPAAASATSNEPPAANESAAGDEEKAAAENDAKYTDRT